MAVVVLRQALRPMTLFCYRGDTPGTNQVAEFRMDHMVCVISLWAAQVWGMGTADIGRYCQYPINHPEIVFENYTGRTGNNRHRKPWEPVHPPYGWQSRFLKPAPWTSSVQLPAR